MSTPSSYCTHLVGGSAPFWLLVAALTVACTPTVTSTSAGDDLRLLARFVDAVHPAPYRYVDADTFAATVEAEAEALDALDAPDDLRVGRSVHRSLALLGDFHAQVSLPLYSSDTPLTLLPLLAVRVDEGIAVDAATHDWPPGTLVTAIDDTDIETLIDDLLSLVAADGLDPAAAEAVLLSDLPRFYALGHGMAPDYTLTVELPDGTLEQVTLDGAARTDMAALRAARRTDAITGRQPPAPSLERLDDHTALLRLPTFGVADMDGYRAELDALLDDGLDGVDHLLVDVRGNPGGLRPNGFVVLDRLFDAPYPQWRGFEARLDEIPAEYTHLVSPMVSRPLADSLPPGPPWRFEGDPLLEWMHPTGDFDGQVTVLTDALTNSAANTFVLSLETHHPDTLVVGVAPGGACDQHIGEYPVALVLPHTGVAVAMSVIQIDHVAPDRCVPGHGLTPDLHVGWSRRDLIEGTDPVVRAALEP